MTLRTPRRRISPQTKRRCRAIKGFFRRALGSTSQQHLQITSSIAVNVTDLKHKIVGLEHQLNEVSRHCREIASVENSLRGQSHSFINTALKEDISQDQRPPHNLRGVETKIIYKTPQDPYKRPDESNCVVESYNEASKLILNKDMNDLYTDHTKTNIKNSKLDTTPKDYGAYQNLRSHKTKSEYDKFLSTYSTSSLHSFARFRENFHSHAGFSGNVAEKRDYVKLQKDHYNVTPRREKSKYPNFVDNRCPADVEDKHVKNKKTKRILKQLDEDFIADIIRRQYKPISMFGRRESDFSQFSAPVCRDREFCRSADNNDTKDNAHLCDCCCGGRHFTRAAHHSDHSDMRSVCDARLYSLNRKTRVKKQKKPRGPYNDSDIYDLVPVKEKSSPKSRRKFYENNIPSPAYYKEVPPSPRSQRPRLNLKAQYYTELDDDDNIRYVRTPRKRLSPKGARRHREYEDLDEYYNPTETRHIKKLRNVELDTMRSFQYPAFQSVDNIVTVETPLNKTQETVSSADKTDKALCEIKDILQSFLQEIKKEATSHSDKSEVNSKIYKTGNSLNNVKTLPDSGQTFNNYNPPQCPVVAPPYVPAFTNTCCYPIMPMCPMNCMQNSFAIPSTSLTCTKCATKCSETCYNKNATKTDKANDTLNEDTDELIKQIYDFVSTSPKFSKKLNPYRIKSNERIANTADNKLRTSRSAGGSTISRHDAKVGTAKMRCVSKSCEAICSKIITDTSSGDTNGSYSDTVLEKMNFEPTTSETELTTDISEADQAKRNKFTKMLRSLGLKKKHNRDVIEELSESESTIEVQVNKRKPPFRQNVTNYLMHGQEYYQQPPVSPHYRQEHSQSYGQPYSDYPVYNPRMQKPISAVHHSGLHPSAPPYSQSYDGYNQMQPQVPLCLKEIEVKSIGCQSERKMSFFRKLTQKMQPPLETMNGDNIQRNCSTQTAQDKPKLFNWMNAQSKEIDSRNNPYAYGYKTQKKLADGDRKMRNAMMKKMFHKRNPFSPRNLIIRTLLGKDKSSYGDPPALYRPRMFI